jgi:hypothetical protein
VFDITSPPPPHLQTQCVPCRMSTEHHQNHGHKPVNLFHSVGNTISAKHVFWFVCQSVFDWSCQVSRRCYCIDSAAAFQSLFCDSRCLVPMRRTVCRVCRAHKDLWCLVPMRRTVWRAHKDLWSVSSQISALTLRDLASGIRPE